MLFYIFKILIIIGLIYQFFGLILLIFDIRPTLYGKKTIDEALNRNHKHKGDIENIFSIIVDIFKHKTKIIWLEMEPNKILNFNEREKEHAIRFKWGLILIISGISLQIISVIGSS